MIDLIESVESIKLRQKCFSQSSNHPNIGLQSITTWFLRELYGILWYKLWKNENQWVGRIHRFPNPSSTPLARFSSFDIHLLRLSMRFSLCYLPSMYQSTFSQGLWGRDFQRQFPLFLLRSQKIRFLPSINHKSDHFEWHLFPQNLTFFHFAFNPRTFWEGTKSLNSFCFMSHHLFYSESSSCISKQKILHHLLSNLIWSNLLTGERVTVVGEYVEPVSLLLSVDVFCNIRTIDVFEFHHFLNPQRREIHHI